MLIIFIILKKMTKTILDQNLPINSFDKFQREAIFSEHKTSLINAGAGSGKTTTIIGRIIYCWLIKCI